MEINDYQSRRNWPIKWQYRYKDTSSLPGDQAWSRRYQADENEVNGGSTRRRKATEKGRTYRPTLLKARGRRSMEG